MSRPISDPVFDIGRDLQRAYDDGYKQGRYDEKVETETSLPSKEKKMNRQRKVVITVTYNDLGMIVDTKTEELNLSAQPNLQQSCNQLATDTISRQAAIDSISADIMGGLNYESILKKLPSAERPTGEWVFDTQIPISGGGSSAGYRCSICGRDYFHVDGMNFCPNCGSYNGGESDDKG